MPRALPSSASRLPRLILLLLAHSADGAKRKKRRSTVPVVPSEYYNSEDPSGGCPFHRAVSDVEPQEISAFGHELERDGRQAEALRCYAAAIRAHPTDARAWFDLSVAQQHVEPARALQFYKHGVSLDPTSFHYNQLGVMLRVATRHSEATQRFIQAARLAPADADPLFNLGGSHETLDRHSEALHAYRGALERERKNEARIQNNIGNVLGKMGRWKDALAAYHEAQEADPDFPETLQNLAHVKEQMGQLDEAVEHLQAAAKLLPTTPELAQNLTDKREELVEKRAERKKATRQAERRDEVNKRDGHMSREERVQRFQEVLGRCGMDKDCMRKLLKQEDAQEGDMVVF